ncbi:hypothetical protein [Isorropodon fossajaponicum symbiont]|uniref:hypothetical protein n=1 Tax=Isorropodon fossajaponicum symbiont TaxID=883811 RepID=UPI0019157258|nr:hypothetical protein [Isorropodon fossajaponicum symbiont]
MSATTGGLWAGDGGTSNGGEITNLDREARSLGVLELGKGENGYNPDGSWVYGINTGSSGGGGIRITYLG